MGRSRKNVVTYVIGEDFEGLYVNGKMASQGSLIHPDDALDAVSELNGKFKLDKVAVDEEWLEGQGFFPDNLEDVKVRTDLVDLV